MAGNDQDTPGHPALPIKFAESAIKLLKRNYPEIEENNDLFINAIRHVAAAITDEDPKITRHRAAAALLLGRDIAAIHSAATNEENNQTLLNRCNGYLVIQKYGEGNMSLGGNYIVRTNPLTPDSTYGGVSPEGSGDDDNYDDNANANVEDGIDDTNDNVEDGIDEDLEIDDDGTADVIAEGNADGEDADEGDDGEEVPIGPTTRKRAKGSKSKSKAKKTTNERHELSDEDRAEDPKVEFMKTLVPFTSSTFPKLLRTTDAETFGKTLFETIQSSFTSKRPIPDQKASQTAVALLCMWFSEDGQEFVADNWSFIANNAAQPTLPKELESTKGSVLDQEFLDLYKSQVEYINKTREAQGVSRSSFKANICKAQAAYKFWNKRQVLISQALAAKVPLDEFKSILEKTLLKLRINAKLVPGKGRSYDWYVSQYLNHIFEKDHNAIVSRYMTAVAGTVDTVSAFLGSGAWVLFAQSKSWTLASKCDQAVLGQLCLAMCRKTRIRLLTEVFNHAIVIPLITNQVVSGEHCEAFEKALEDGHWGHLEHVVNEALGNLENQEDLLERLTEAMDLPLPEPREVSRSTLCTPEIAKMQPTPRSHRPSSK